MNINKKITNAEDATQFAIDWQKWVCEVQNLSYGELAEWSVVFETLADKFDLREEFSTNGII